MAIESRLQSQISKWLRDNGAYVVKLQAGPSVPSGAPDILCMYGTRWVAIEVKASESARFQPLQKHTLERLTDWNKGMVFVATPATWPAVKDLISDRLFRQARPVKLQKEPT